MTEISPEAQKKIQEAVNHYPGGWTSGLCAFQLLDRKTGAYLGGRKDHGECHAPLSYPRGGTETSICVSAHKAKWHKEHPEFMVWLAEEAPFSHGVLNGDNRDEYLQHAAVIDVEKIGTAGALWQCKAMRHFTEDTFKLKYWDELRSHGLDGLQAFLGADILDSSGGPGPHTHVCLFSYGPPDQLRKFYDKVKGAKHWKGGQACQDGGWYAYGENRIKVWGNLKHKIVKQSDGWGGFTEVKKPCDSAEYAAKIKEITEGDPKNVK
jgi:hypothetical protein